MYNGFIQSGAVASGANYIFTTSFVTNNNLTYDSSTGIFTITQPGIYDVYFYCSCANNTAASGLVTPTLVLNGVASTKKLTSATSTGSTNVVSVAMNTPIRVVVQNGSTATLAVENAGVAVTVNSGEITIERRA